MSHMRRHYNAAFVLIILFTFLAQTEAACDCGSECTTNCPNGQYWTVDACRACEAGYYCLGGTRTACNAGQSSSAGATSHTACQDCARGTYASSAGTGTCTACADGFYAPNLATSTCTQCPVGKQCADKINAVQCAVGHISVTNALSCSRCPNDKITNTAQSLCIDCPAGKLCTDSTLVPTSCALGTYSPAGQATCTQCPAGSSCADPATQPSALPVACATGTYSTIGEATCTPCPAFHKCPVTNAVPVKCADGEYAAAQSSTCNQCPKGSFCPSNATSASPCATGYYQDQLGQTSCIPCPVGKRCSDKTAAPTDCAIGSYSTQGAGTCTPCPMGYACPDPAAQPVACDAGTYILNSVCTVCPAGSFCETTTANPIACTAGSYSSPGATQCTQCPAGYQCPSRDNTTAISACQPGSYSILGQIDCTQCPAGKACPNPAQATVITCSQGSYSMAGSISCTECPAGFRCPSTSAVPVACKDGEYSTYGATACTQCPAGYMCPTTNGTLHACNPGTYSVTGSQQCTECPAGFFCPRTDTESKTPCTPGTFSTGNQTTCSECFAGYYCPNTNSNSTTKCSPGTYSLKNAEECTPCPEGFYCPNGIDAPKKCLEGTYSIGRAVNCTTCEAGYYCSSTEGSRKTQCPPGTYSNAGATSCQPCETGYVCRMGSTSATPEAGLCNRGGYCDGKVYVPCPPGTYNPLNGSKGVAACLACIEGFYCQGPGEVESNRTLCPKGHYCPVGTKTASEHPCPAGFYNTDTGSPSRSACQLCPAGRYCTEGSESDGFLCPTGFFCTEGQPRGSLNSCPAGTWSNVTGLVNASQCLNCKAGYYCPAGTESEPRTSELPCAPGTFNNFTGMGHVLSCRRCLGGFACPIPATTLPTTPCEEGHYCPEGSISANQYPCPTGTFTGATNLTTANQCSACPAGQYCTWGTGVTVNPPQPCKPGYYCPAQTPAPDRFPCPAGTLSSLSNLTKAADCTPCPPGYFCVGAKTIVSGDCPKGYYCPESTKIGTENGCPNSTYNDALNIGNVSQCINCWQGHYCEFAVNTPTACRAGSYMDEGMDRTTSPWTLTGSPAKRQFDCKTCPGGYFCTGGTIHPTQCGTGKYSKAGSSACLDCPIGYYCDQADLSEANMTANKACPAGKFCGATSLSSLTQATDCTTGHYCPKGTKEELKCPVGTMRGAVGAGAITDCEPCTAGYYCLETSTTPTGHCDPGYYCPTNFTNPFLSPPRIGSYGKTQVPCPPGTYAPNTATTSLNGCLNCTAGKYCREATSVPETCPRGSYCVGGSTFPTPCPIGTYGKTTDLKSVAECTPCDGGKYCDAPGLLQPRGPCDPGYLCRSGAITSSPNDNRTGEICPAGGFCPSGSSTEKPCPMGTYSNVTGAVNNQDCKDCPEGFYCSEVAGGAPTGKCWGGYYCTGKAYNPIQHVTPPGYYSPNGSSQALACQLGTFNPVEGQSDCLNCTAGFYCEMEAMTNATICGPGTYCAEGSKSMELCPPGTFSNRSELSQVSQCSDCTPGYYCQNRGSTEPEGPCKAGHVCYKNALYDNPNLNKDPTGGQPIVTWGDVCSPGYYCPEGSNMMLPCPIGTYNPTTAMFNLTKHCLPCPGGKACLTAGLATTDESACLADPRGTTYAGKLTRTRTGYTCQRWDTNTPHTNTYTDPTKYPETTLNLAENYCRNPSNDNAGPWCYTTDPNVTMEYCSIPLCSNITGDCSAGYYCTGGATTTTPPGDATGGLCPLYHYCPKGSKDPIPCEAGRLANTTGAVSCDLCPGGYLCQRGVNAKQCSTGYYCPASVVGNLVVQEIPCPIGTINPLLGRSNLTECISCPSGYYCETPGLTNVTGPMDAGSWSITGARRRSYTQTTTTHDYGQCPRGFYCPQGTSTPKPCPAGTYGTNFGLRAESDCIQCPPGFACENLNSTECDQNTQTGCKLCTEGYYCTGGSPTKTPDNATYGGICPYGHRCTKGIKYECIASTFNNMIGQYQCAHCPQGFFCPPGTIAPVFCPKGHYCLQSRTNATIGPCPSGTFLNVTGARTASWCLQCTPGHYCQWPGIAEPTGLCHAGFYCLAGSTNASFNSKVAMGGPCEPGNYCPEGSPNLIPCPAGYYCDSEQMSNYSSQCSMGYYCTLGARTATPTDGVTGNKCPLGHYCPTGSGAGTPCPSGTYRNETGGRSELDCFSCPLGHYCAGQANERPTNSCLAGYYCEMNETQANPPAKECPKGHYCPRGSSAPRRCPSGTYQDESSQGNCKMCPAGFFCDNTRDPVVLFNNTICPTGHYCPNGTKYDTEFKCPEGTFNNITGAQESSGCMNCPGGYVCDAQAISQVSKLCTPGFFCRRNARSATPNQGDDANRCPISFYCPQGTADPISCPRGTYSTTPGLNASSDCTNCTAGMYCGELNMTAPSGACWARFYCPSGSEIPTQVDCPAGAYCGNGTVTPNLCPVSTWSNSTNRKSVSDCLPCPGGSYCDAQGLSAPTGLCKEGYFCPENSTQQVPTDKNCTVGHYCPTGVAQPIPCQNNSYANVTHATACSLCPAGHYCEFSGIIKICPQGFYCPEGTGVNWRPCPSGTYGARPRLTHVEDCTICPGGKYCGGTALQNYTGNCSPGHWCAMGVDVRNPNGTYDFNTTEYNNCTKGWGGRCPIGHYCPESTIFPIPCENGTYIDQIGQSQCLTCPAGYFCQSGATEFLPNECPIGHYCLPGTFYDRQNPCPAGTFNNATRGKSLEDCVSCPGGMFCRGNGNSNPTGICEAGYFCSRRSNTPTPFGVNGDKCSAGTYCPVGSSAPQSCTPGHFCAVDYLNATSGLCSVGYFCTNGSNSSDPTDGIAGDNCPLGHYCTVGSPAPTPCPSGTYMNRTHAEKEEDCIQCPAGKFCSSTGNINPTGLCEEGYYCPPGLNTNRPANYTCPRGYHCPAGSATYLACKNGEYQDEPRKAACKNCPEGYFCDNTAFDDPTISLVNKSCPQGFYCVNNTSYATQYPCVPGTYSNLTHRVELEDCQPCLPGMYCMSQGLPTPQGLCSAGYYCRKGAASSTPLQDINANECPPGFFCPQGSPDYLSCPAGTFSNASRLNDVSECINCTGGRYCPEVNMTQHGPLCRAGYYCPSRADNATFIECPAGYYCVEGSVNPQPCPAGSYSNRTELKARAECTICPAGWYCQQSSLTSPEALCLQGYYCPAGSNVSNQIICPIGLHCPTGADQPKSCSSGYYTNTTGTWQCELCPQGFFCLPVNLTDAGMTGARICSAGYYCPNGTGEDLRPCPKGTYSPQTGLDSITQCRDCDGGRYCNSNAATTVTGLCSPGHYCTSGVDRSDPDSGNSNRTVQHICPIIGGHTGFGDVCPLGMFCVGGMSQPQGCPAGDYQDQLGQDKCKTCVEGYYCLPNSTTYTTQSCPLGHFCPNGTTHSIANPCPVGTYNPVLRQSVPASCLPCNAGMACESEGLGSPNTNCTSGWYCSVGAKNATPANPEEGGQCQPGYYCPEGSWAPLSCLPGQYCATAGLSAPTRQCSAGYFCVLNATTATPTDGVTGNICPKGSFCPVGSGEPTKCSVGTYLNSTANSAVTACAACDPGQYCDREGLSTPSGDCNPGYYCPTGQDTATPANYTCPQGHYCPGGRGTPDPCPSGTYQDGTGKPTCKVCPASFYCNATSGPVIHYAGLECPTGHYCGNGTRWANEFPCPVGTYNNATSIVSITDCTLCTGGMACDRTGLTVPERPCSVGYFCKRSARTTSPSQGIDANICPPGHYCPQETTNPVPCPAGTFSNNTGLGDAQHCFNCTAGYYCNETGLIAVDGPCTAGYYCPPASTEATQIICPVGHYCPQTSGEPTKCPNGTYANGTGLPSEASCTQCTPGQFCPTTGMTYPQGDCTAGYYCPLGSNSAVKIVCPIGTYCPTGSPLYQLCPDKTMASVVGESSCSQCPEGWYCVSNLISPGVASSIRHPCPEGFFCPNGTGYDWKACPLGTFSNTTGLRRVEECLPCVAGEYCQGANLTAPSGSCAPGYYCTSGSKIATPTGADTCAGGHAILANICPVGHHCPGGTDFPIPCPAGTFQDQTTQPNCKICPGGYYCLANTSVIDNSIICPAGYYCPPGTNQSNANPCIPGTFNNQTGQNSSMNCVPCTPGHFCEGYANVVPDGSCTAGWYCTGGDANATQNECPIRSYCPEGSPHPLNCTAGKYCSRTKLALPEGDCDSGYYCPESSASRQEIPCPVGRHCVFGSSMPTNCPNGTFGPIQRLRNEGECSPCSAGSYCNDTGLSVVSGPCAPGYYCPPGQVSDTPAEFICPLGHYCVGGKGAPDICLSGTYQPLLGQTSCSQCPIGFYCDNSGGAVGNLTNKECPSGYYCPLGTTHSTQYPCDAGTFNNVTGTSSKASCTGCLPRYACNTPGLSYPLKLCSPGFYCVGNNTISTPPETICPIGQYCPEGSYRPTPCPDGTISHGNGSMNVSDCKPCNPGSYCTVALSQQGIQLPCHAGYICSGGSYIPKPTNGIIGYSCPLGHYCPIGAVREVPCEPATYAPINGTAVCPACPAGSTCPNYGMSVPLPCPVGFYCRNGTLNNGTGCPVGTFNPITNLSLESQCLNCSVGQYCEIPGIHTPTANCSEGYFCVRGAKIATPNDGVNGPCPLGRYCHSGTHEPVDCPVGTYRGQTGARFEADCTPCRPGYYCNGTGLINPSGICEPRFYCPDIAKIGTARPNNFKCPSGFYCPANTSVPFACPPGKYQPNEGSTDCVLCPAGTYCLANTSVPLVCPRYSYCLNGTIDPIPCPNGYYTFDNVTGLEEAAQCAECPPGVYCTGGSISGNCTPGFWCKRRADRPNPVNSTGMGEVCPVGYYCPAGTTIPLTCPPGKVIALVGAYSEFQCDICPAGYICPPGSKFAEKCPPGYYCVFGYNMTACPPYTYNPAEAATNKTWCLACPAGYYCDQEGTANATRSPCSPGFFCVEGARNPDACPPGTYRESSGGASIDDCDQCQAGYYCQGYNVTERASISGIQCDEGYYCPLGSQNQTKCQPGYYCNRTMTQKPCPPGYYCPEMSSYPKPCPKGHYCGGIHCENGTDIPGAREPIKCPLGYKEYDGAPRATFKDTCEPCRPGYYGNDTDRDSCRVCQAGVVCLERATSDQPLYNTSADLGVNGTRSYPCPAGYYCPRGTGAPKPCQIGHYNPSKWGTSMAACLPCPMNYFQDHAAQTGCLSCGGQSYQNVMGSGTCKCVGGGRDFQHSDRSCPCRAGYQLADDDRPDGECAKIVYPLCKKYTYRNVYGVCWTKDEWKEHCRNRECQSSSDFVEMDTSVPMCKCKVEDLEELCDLQCRFNQQSRLTFHCPAKPLPSFIRVTDSNGHMKMEVPAYNLRRVVNWINALGDSFCPTDRTANSSTTLSVTEVNQNGFLGVYEPDVNQLMNMLTNNTKGVYSTNVTGRVAGGFITRRLLATSPLAGSVYSGVLNPIACLENGQTMIWSVSNTNYPIYDKNNLLNTNDQFDYGGFRTLVEAMAQASSTTSLFSFKFTDAGTYAFKLSSNAFKIMYIRVMPANTKCPVLGPFLPPTPLNYVQVGLRLQRGILLEPNWLLLGIFIACLILALVILLLIIVLFRRYGWSKSLWIYPFYRYITRKRDFDEYASRGSSVHSYNKVHPNLRREEQIESAREAGDGTMVSMGPASKDLPNSEFWDYDRQVDLEGFSARTVYSTLDRQSLGVTREIAKQKGHMKDLYQKVNTQAESLRSLWMAKLNNAVPMTSEDLERYNAKLRELEAELLRRKEIGILFHKRVSRQMELLQDEDDARRRHYVNFQAILRETLRYLQEPAADIRRNQALQKSLFLLDDMQRIIDSESARTSQSKPLGARLVAPGKRTVIALEELTGSNLSDSVKSIVTFDKQLGVYTPNANTSIQETEASVPRTIPPNCFIHPRTGFVLHQSGNLIYSVQDDKFLPSVNSIDQNLPQLKQGTLPYIVHPRKGPVKLAGSKESGLKIDTPMRCPKTGLPCPILAVTIHPQTRAILPVGGTHTDPVTGMPVAIEMGGLMFDPNTKCPVPIVGVCIDPDTGFVLPVGETNMLLFDQFLEPLSSQPAKLTFSGLDEENFRPSAGGSSSYAIARLLSQEIKVKKMLTDNLEQMAGGKRPGAAFQTQDIAATIENLEQAATLVKQDMLNLIQNADIRLLYASRLASNGGSPGWYEYHKSGKLLPILTGTLMEDPGGSDFETPIISYRSTETGMRPIGGTMEDPGGSGLLPIIVGRQAVDPQTGTLSTVVGASIDPETETVIPVTLASNPWRPRVPDPAMAARLEEEMAGRKSYWRRMRNLEDDITKAQYHLSARLVYSSNVISSEELETSINAIQSEIADFDHLRMTESQRRAEFRTALPESVVRSCVLLRILLENDDSEAGSGEQLSSMHQKYISNVERICNKLKEDQEDFQLDALEEDEGESVSERVLLKHERKKAHLRTQLSQGVTTLMESLDKQHADLTYWQRRSELLLIDGISYFLGKLTLAGDYDWSYVSGDEDGDQDNDELLALLKQLIALLGSGGPFYLSADILNLIQGGTTIIGTGAGGQSGRGAGLDISAHGEAYPRKEDMGLVTKQFEGDDDPSRSFGLQSDDSESAYKDLYANQALAIAQAEAKLHDSETFDMTAVIERNNKQKDDALAAMQEELKDKLKHAKSDREKEKIAVEFAEKMDGIIEDIEENKQAELAATRKSALERRRNLKKKLKRMHMDEMAQYGFKPEMSPDVRLQSNDEINNDLLQLQKLQEELLSDLRLAEKKSTSEITPTQFNRIRSLRTGGGVSAKEPLSVESDEDSMASLMNSLHKRKRRKRTAKKDIEKEASLPDEEKAKLMESIQKQSDNDAAVDSIAVISAMNMALNEELVEDSRNDLERQLANAKDAEERDRILNDFNEQQRHFTMQQRATRDAQTDALFARLAAGKHMKNALARENAVDEELLHMARGEAEKLGGKNVEVFDELHNRIDSEIVEKLKPIISQQEERLEQLELAHIQAVQKQEDGLDDELSSKLRELDEKSHVQKQLCLDEHRHKFERDIADKAPNDDEYKKLLEKHKQEEGAILNSLEQERLRQKKKIEDKMRDRKLNARESSTEEHNEKLKDVMGEQQMERDHHRKTLSKDIEQDVLSRYITGMKPEEAENLIYYTILPRHLREMVDLEGELKAKCDTKVAKETNDVQRKRAEERSQLQEAFAEQINDLMKNPDGLSVEDLEKRRNEREQMQGHLLEQFDEMTAFVVDRVKKETTRDSEVGGIQDRIDLKEKQLEELENIFKKLSPDDKLKKKYAAILKKYRDEVEKYRRDLLKANEDAVKTKAIYDKEEREKEQLLAQRLASLDADIDKEVADEEDKLRKRQDAEAKITRQKLEERLRREESEVKKSSMSEDEKNRILREQTALVAQMEAALKERQERQKEDLQSRLNARRNRMKKLAVAEIYEKEQLDTEKRLMEKLMNLQGSEEADIDLLRANMPTADMGGSEEDDWFINLLMSSPLFTAVTDIEDFMTKLSALPGGLENFGQVELPSRETGAKFIDERDAEFWLEGKLSAISVSSLTPGQTAAYHFGVMIVKLLHREADGPNIRVLIAETLPENNYSNNAFRNSIFYEHTSETLFVRKERLNNAGDFLLVLVHSISHIYTKDLKDDNNPLHMKYFYRFLRIVCRHVLFNRDLSDPTGQLAKKGLSVDQVAQAMEARIADIMATEPPENAGIKAGEFERARARATVHNTLSYSRDPSYRSVQDRLNDLLRGKKAKSANSSTTNIVDVVSGQLNKLYEELTELSKSLTQVLRDELKEVASLQMATDASKPDLEAKIQHLRAQKQQIMNQQTRLESEITQKEAYLKGVASAQ